MSQDRSGQDRSGQERSSRDRTSQVRRDQVKTGEVRTGRVRTGKVRKGLKMHLKMEFDSGVGPTCLIVESQINSLVLVLEKICILL